MVHPLLLVNPSHHDPSKPYDLNETDENLGEFFSLFLDTEDFFFL